MSKNNPSLPPSSNRPPHSVDTPSSIRMSDPAQMRYEQQVSLHSGPLPPAEEFRQYESVLPGAADRILTMAENQARHRQSMEQTVVRQGSRDSFCGLTFGFLLGMACILGGIYCALQGVQLFGFGTILTALASLLGVFVYGSRQRRKEREAKAQTMPRN